jgi:hypothetical protein
MGGPVIVLALAFICAAVAAIFAVQIAVVLLVIACQSIAAIWRTFTR